MNYAQRSYPLFSACGLNCGLCPRYHTQGTSRCPGCAGDGFSEKHPPCGILSCSQRHGIDYCYLCDEYPCKKYDGADLADSFITHLHQRKDLDKAKATGIESYQAELNEKVAILQTLLGHFDDGRRKGFFCLAVNLLPLDDCKAIMDRLTQEINPDDPPKQKAEAAVRLFEAIARQQGVALRLRK